LVQETVKVVPVQAVLFELFGPALLDHSQVQMYVQDIADDNIG
jgi:hypothetical protein